MHLCPCDDSRKTHIVEDVCLQLDELIEFCEHLESMEELYDVHMKPDQSLKLR